MFELLGEFFPRGGEQNKGDSSLFARGFIRQLQHASGAFTIIFRTAGYDRPVLVFVHPASPFGTL